VNKENVEKLVISSFKMHLHTRSISPTFYGQLLRRYFLPKIYKAKLYVDKNTFVQKSCFLKCWWNRHIWDLFHQPHWLNVSIHQFMLFGAINITNKTAHNFTTLGVNVINILREHLSYESTLCRFSLFTFWLCDFLVPKYRQKMLS